MEVFELSLILSSSVGAAVALLLCIYFTFVKTRNVAKAEIAENYHDISYRENQPLSYPLEHWEQLNEILIRLVFWKYHNKKKQFENSFIHDERP